MTEFSESWSSSISAQNTPDPASIQAVVSCSDSIPSQQSVIAPSTIDSKSITMFTRHKIMWTPEMENTALELYIRAVQEGKRSENGFVPDTHRSIARQLNHLFPNIDLDEKKVKSKYNQSFKRDYDTLKFIRSTNGFKWDEASCEVTASDEVWNLYLASHPQVKKFRGTPCPQSRQLELLFRPFTPFSNGLEPTAAPSEGPSFTPLSNPENGFVSKIESSTHSEGVTSFSAARNHSRSPTRFQPQFSSPIDRMMVATDTARHASYSELTKVEQAVDQLQEEFSHLLNEMELLNALSILESDTKAQVFLRLRSHDLRIRWLQQQFQNLRQHSSIDDRS